MIVDYAEGHFLWHIRQHGCQNKLLKVTQKIVPGDANHAAP